MQSPMKTVWLEGTTSRWVTALAVLYMISIACTAWMRLDLTWDSVAYHLPFAAIRAGIVTYRDFVVPGHHMALLDGFPPVLDFIKGMLWRLTGRPEATQLFNLILVGGGSLVLARAFRLPAAIAILAVLAIPVGQIEFASNYTDLPVNFLLAFALFSAVHAWISPELHRGLHGALAAGALCMATTFKVTAIPFSLIIWAVYVFTASFSWKGTADTYLGRTRKASLSRYLLLIVLGALVSLGYGLVNLIKMGNPLFPVPIDFGFISLPGTVPTSNWAAASYVMEYPRPIRWLLSVLEWHAFDSRPLPYTISQGDVPETAKSYRMGGLFAQQLLFTIVLLLLLGRRINGGLIFRVLVLHAGAGIVVSMVPGSHEMRYFFFWHLCLLWSTYALLDKLDDKAFAALFLTSLAASTIYVTSITGARYVYPFKDLRSAAEMAESGIREVVLEHIRSGERAFCVVDKDPFGFLYSKPFNEEVTVGIQYQVSADPASAVCKVLSTSEGISP
jgi:hypothetical protein